MKLSINEKSNNKISHSKSVKYILEAEDDDKLG